METVIPAPDVRRARGRDSIVWFALVALAAVLRLGPIASGLPYFDYIDEGHILQPAIGILKSKSFDSSVYAYPPLTSYLVVAALKAYAPFYRKIHHRELWNDLPADEDLHTELGDRYDLVSPPEVIWIGRLVVACLSVGTVILAGALGKLLGGSRAGLLAMLFTAVCPALVSRGSIVILDTTATFFVLATLYFCQRLRLFAASNHPAMWRNALFAGIAAGLAFAGKFTVGAVFAAVPVTVLLLPLAKKSKAILLMLAGGGLFIGIFCGVPGAVLHTEKILGEIRYIASFYQTIRAEQGYWRAAFSGWEIGVSLMTVGLAGIGWMSWNRSTRSVVVSWIGFALVLLPALVFSRFQPFRNLLSLVPPLCIAAALLCDRLAEYFARPDRRWALTSWLAPALFLAVALPLAWFSLRHLQLRVPQVDTRVRAINWLQQHATKDETVLGIRELAILPAEWKRIPARSSVVSWFEALDLLQRHRFDYIVTGEFDLRHARDPEGWSAYRDRWRTKVAPLTVRADFGQVVTPVVPYLWRTADERILILQGDAED